MAKMVLPNFFVEDYINKALEDNKRYIAFKLVTGKVEDIVIVSRGKLNDKDFTQYILDSNIVGMNRGNDLQELIRKLG